MNHRAAGAPPHFVIPVNAGIHVSAASSPDGWVPAFAGTTMEDRPQA
jgi:hypothetical protein